MSVLFVPMKVKKQKRMSTKTKPETEVVASAPSTQGIASVSTTVTSPPPPDVLHEMAMGEVDRKLLSDYRSTIEILRHEKSFSFREIAEWLTSHGLDCDYNDVYREYTRGMSGGEEAKVADEASREDSPWP